MRNSSRCWVPVLLPRLKDEYCVFKGAFNGAPTLSLTSDSQITYITPLKSVSLLVIYERMQVILSASVPTV